MNTDILKIVSENIVLSMKIKGMTQEEFAKFAGVSQKTISNLKNATKLQRHPKLDVLEKIANALNVPVFYLLIPSINERTLNGDFLGFIVETCNTVNTEGLLQIRRVAESEARYKITN